MINQLKNKLLSNSKFFINEDIVNDNDYFSIKIEPSTAFSFHGVNNVIITINENIEQETNKTICYFGLDFGCDEIGNIQKQTELLEKIVNDKNLVHHLIVFLKNETGLDFSTYTFKKPFITLIEEGVIEIEFY